MTGSETKKDLGSVKENGESISNINQNPENQEKLAYYKQPASMPRQTYQVKRITPEEQRAKDEKNAHEFSRLGIASLIYALIFAVCLYKNFSGVPSFVWSVATIYYFVYVTKNFGGVWKGINTFISAVIVLLGISNFCTDNTVTMLLNYMVIFGFIFINGLLLFVETKGVNVSKHIFMLLSGIIGSMVELFTPFIQMRAYFKKFNIRKNEKLIYGLIGLAVAIPMVVVVTVILASADGVFLNIFDEIIETFDLIAVCADVIVMGIMFAFAFEISYIYIARVKSGIISADTKKTANLEPIIAVMCTAAISFVYVVFSLIQIYYLFLGQGELPEEYTYAEYAREGFFQLLAIAIFNVVLVLVCIEFFKNSKILSALLLLVNGCTFIMIASSAYRMIMYISQYGLTYTRVFVLWALALIALIVVGLTCQIAYRKFSLFKYALVVSGLSFIVFSFSHTDYFVAKYNLNMYKSKNMEALEESENYADYRYLSELSADAVPAIAENWKEFSEHREEDVWYENYYSWMYWDNADVKEDYVTLWNFNVSRYIAEKYLEAVDE